MQELSLIFPKEVVFHHVGGVEKLPITNPTKQKIAIKIRTNHKTALHINPTHDFLDGDSKKDIFVKLIQLHQGVKLQVNYTKVTQEMIAKNDSKLSNVDKKDIKKQIISINVNQIKTSQISQVKSKESIPDDVNTSFSTVVPQKTQSLNKSVEKKVSISSTSLKDSQNLISEQKEEQQLQQMEEKKKKINNDIKDLQRKIQQKRVNILNKKQQLSEATASNSFVPPFTIPIIVVGSFLIGSLIKSLLF